MLTWRKVNVLSSLYFSNQLVIKMTRRKADFQLCVCYESIVLSLENFALNPNS